MPDSRALGLFLIDETNDYQAGLRSEAEDAARRHGRRLRVFSAGNSTSEQVEQIRRVTAGESSERLSAVLVSPVSEMALLSLMHSTGREGIAWVFLNRWHKAIEDLRRQYPEVPIFSVTADQEQVGSIQGQQVRRIAQPGDELLLLQGPLGASSTKARAVGLLAGLGEADVSTTALHCDWTEAGGKAVTTQWLNMLGRAGNSGLIVAAQNDSMALGAREAIVEWGCGHRRGRMDVLGCDGSPSLGQAMVSAGELTATVVIPSVVGTAIDALAGGAGSGYKARAEMKVPVQPFPALDAIGPRKSTGRLPV